MLQLKDETPMSNSASSRSQMCSVHFVVVQVMPLLHRNLWNRNIFKVVQEVKNLYAKAVRAPQCTHPVVLPRTLQRPVGPFEILQVPLRIYSLLQGRLVYDHFNKAPFPYCMPRSNGAS